MIKISKQIKAWHIFIVLLLSTAAIFISISCRMQIKAYFPNTLGFYNTMGYAMISYIISLMLSIVFIIKLKYKIWIKLIILPILLYIILWHSIPLGHKYVIPMAKSYYKSNKSDMFNLVNQARSDSICLISKINHQRNLILKDCRNNKVINDRVYKSSKKLGFMSYRGFNNITIIYEFSMWGGYGFYFSSEKKDKPKSIGYGEIAREWIEVDNNVYYFTFY